MCGRLDSLVDAMAPLRGIAYMALICIVLANWAVKAQAHVVQEIYGVASSDGAVLRLDLLLDATYGLPDGNDPFAPQPRRDWLFSLSPREHEQLRQNSRKLIESILVLSSATEHDPPREIPFALSFPDYDSMPQSFPKLMSGGAYLTVRLEAPLPADGPLQIEQVNREYPYLVVNVLRVDDGEPEYLIAYAGEGPVSLPFVREQRSEYSAPKTQARQQTVAPSVDPQSADPQSLKPSIMLSWSSIKFFLIEGYRHVIPYGWDHILFIAALCLLSFEWRALVEQSLLFTLAHSLTLALAIQGFVRLPASIVEAIIALSIAWMAIENLFVTRVKPMRLAMIGGFGLIHGLGFAYVLGNRISESGRFYQALLFTNLGVELAQLTVIACIFLVFHTCVPIARLPLVQKCVSACIAAVAIVLFATRL